MKQKISFQETLKLPNPIFIDVRSPAEYEKGAIPGAINTPLFDDEERETLGLVYQNDQRLARQKGVTYASSRLPELIEKIETLGESGDPVLYCWRGGMRSSSLHALLEALGIPSFCLQGGYKAFRRFILDQFSTYCLDKSLYVLNGLTGTGKTEVLQILKDMGTPVLDLEKLACHRGSLFGHLGLKKTQNQKDFDALLWICLEEIKETDCLVIEGEGKRIGPVYQPDFLYRAITEGIHILLQAPLPIRVTRILTEYSPSSEEESKEVEEILLSLTKHLGEKRVKSFLSLLWEKNYRELVSELCLQYYDQMYSESQPGKNKFHLVVDSSDTKTAAKEIKDFIEIQEKAEKYIIHPPHR